MNLNICNLRLTVPAFIFVCVNLFLNYLWCIGATKTVSRCGCGCVRVCVCSTSIECRYWLKGGRQFGEFWVNYKKKKKRSFHAWIYTYGSVGALLHSAWIIYYFSFCLTDSFESKQAWMPSLFHTPPHASTHFHTLAVSMFDEEEEGI